MAAIMVILIAIENVSILQLMVVLLTTHCISEVGRVCLQSFVPIIGGSPKGNTRVIDDRRSGYKALKMPTQNRGGSLASARGPD
jgi:hypothetical protein